MNSEDIDLCQRYAAIYKMRGLQPLPSSPTEKKPLIRYSEFWDKKAPDDLFQRFRTSNVQCMTGRFWRLIVIDLDGEQAQKRWNRMGRTPNTWTSHSGGGGRHLWFRLPEGSTEPIIKAFLWKGDEKHEAIERLCDHSLVMAPPSIHPRTGRRYRFESKWLSPLGMGLPADCPDWVLRLWPVVMELERDRSIITRIETQHDPCPERRVVATTSSHMTVDEILAGFPDKIGLVRSWGIKFSVRPGHRSWIPCHAVDREDIHPSAAINRQSGFYIDKGSGLKLNLFDLGVRLGVFRDRPEAYRTLAQGKDRP